MSVVKLDLFRRVSAPPPSQSRHSSKPSAVVFRLALVIIIASLVYVALSLLLAGSSMKVQAAPPALPLSDEKSNIAAFAEVDGHWTKRIRLTFSNTAQAEDLVNFPVLVVLDSNRIDYAETQDAGQDIRFFDADGATVLPHEIERWDESSTSYVWVRVPRIDGASQSDFIWMYYGNPVAADGQDPSNVWTEGYRMVYHLEEDPSASGGVVRDSTSNRFDGTNHSTTDAAGYIANAQEFGGIGQYVNLGTDVAVINEVSGTTLSAWVRPDAVGGSGDILSLSINNADLPTSDSRAAIGRQGSNLQVDARSRDDNGDVAKVSSTSDPFSAGIWHYVVAVIDYANDEISIYIDGVRRVNSKSLDFDNLTTPNTNSTNCALGSEDDGSSTFFDGLIDEARVAAITRSADWITAQYLSMTDAFVVFGSAEDIPLPILSLENWPSRYEIYAGSRLDYSLLVGNAGADASGLVVSDTLPAHTAFGGCGCANASTVTLAEMSQGTGACGDFFYCGLEGDEVVWRMSELAGNRLLQMTFWVTVDAGLPDGSVIVNDNYAVAADGLTPLVINKPVTTTVREVLVSISSAAHSDAVTVGQQLQFTLTVRNDGSLIQGVMITDRLPSGTSFVSCGGALCELAADEPEVRWWLPSLPANGEEQVTFQVYVESAENNAIINEFYGAYILAADRLVTGEPVVVTVLPRWQNQLYLPFVAVSGAAQ